MPTRLWRHRRGYWVCINGQRQKVRSEGSQAPEALEHRTNGVAYGRSSWLQCMPSKRQISTTPRYKRSQVELQNSQFRKRLQMVRFADDPARSAFIGPSHRWAGTTRDRNVPRNRATATGSPCRSATSTATTRVALVHDSSPNGDRISVKWQRVNDY